MNADAVRALVTASRLPDVHTPRQLRQRLRGYGYSDAEILEAVQALLQRAASPRLPGRATARAALQQLQGDIR